ncbi:hypothetical protein [Bradyrhizobium uaiense]|uniref:hypothetical protein n=1 Tax=Bradyrhizobium uaiense TaxID=2594946 RepID=UPI0013D6FBBC|nr:hypothetical protein [Bradyrhizobium uaiense]
MIKLLIERDLPANFDVTDDVQAARHARPLRPSANSRRFLWNTRRRVVFEGRRNKICRDETIFRPSRRHGETIGRLKTALEAMGKGELQKEQRSPWGAEQGHVTDSQRFFSRSRDCIDDRRRAIRFRSRPRRPLARGL